MCGRKIETWFISYIYDSYRMGTAHSFPHIDGDTLAYMTGVGFVFGTPDRAGWRKTRVIPAGWNILKIHNSLFKQSGYVISPEGKRIVYYNYSKSHQGTIMARDVKTMDLTKVKYRWGVYVPRRSPEDENDTCEDVFLNGCSSHRG
jgi:hypothetical protein